MRPCNRSHLLTHAHEAPIFSTNSKRRPPTVPIDTALSFLFGAGTALIVYPHEAVHRRALWAVFLFDLFVFLPMGAYFLLAAPDWSWMYFVPASDIPTALIPAVLACYPLATAIGFITTVRLRHRFGHIVGSAPAVFAVLAIAALAFSNGRLFVVGTYDDYQAQRSLAPLFDSDLTYGLAVCAGILAVACRYFYTYLRTTCKATPPA